LPELLVNIDVDDLERGIEFYVRALDLRVGRRLGASFVELLGAESPIYLLVKAAGTRPFAGAVEERAYSRHWTPVHLDFAVADLERAVEKAERAGARTEGEISSHAWGRMALMADPWGHGFCLLEFSAEGYNAIVDPGTRSPGGPVRS
jgi:predicted enzyme related to lactoylglutathione lyase